MLWSRSSTDPNKADGNLHFVILGFFPVCDLLSFVHKHCIIQTGQFFSNNSSTTIIFIGGRMRYQSQVTTYYEHSNPQKISRWRISSPSRDPSFSLGGMETSERSKDKATVSSICDILTQIGNDVDLEVFLMRRTSGIAQLDFKARTGGFHFVGGLYRRKCCFRTTAI